MRVAWGEYSPGEVVWLSDYYLCQSIYQFISDCVDSGCPHSFIWKRNLVP